MEPNQNFYRTAVLALVVGCQSCVGTGLASRSPPCAGVLAAATLAAGTAAARSPNVAPFWKASEQIPIALEVSATESADAREFQLDGCASPDFQISTESLLEASSSSSRYFFLVSLWPSGDGNAWEYSLAITPNTRNLAVSGVMVAPIRGTLRADRGSWKAEQLRVKDVLDEAKEERRE